MVGNVGMLPTKKNKIIHHKLSQKASSMITKNYKHALKTLKP